MTMSFDDNLQNQKIFSAINCKKNITFHTFSRVVIKLLTELSMMARNLFLHKNRQLVIFVLIATKI